jgi:integrase
MCIRVYPIRPRGKNKYYRLRYKRGDKVLKEPSTETTNRRAAYELARRAEEEANKPQTDWELAADQYQEERYWGSISNRRGWATSRQKFEEFARPESLTDATTRRLSQWASKLRRDGRSEATIRTHLIRLRTFLRWTADQGLLDSPPRVRLPPAGSGGASFPITGEELDRLLAAAEKVMGRQAAASWRRLILGLRWSGLRLGEAHRLWWTGGPDNAIWPQRIHRKRLACFLFRSHTQKGRRDELVKMAEEFRQFLLETPPEQRVGRVFRPRTMDCAGELRCLKTWSKRLSAMGAEAGISREGRPFVAKCLRASFGTAMAKYHVPASTLKHMMRHKHIDTTYRYYVDLAISDIADSLERCEDAGATDGCYLSDCQTPK